MAWWVLRAVVDLPVTGDEIFRTRDAKVFGLECAERMRIDSVLFET